MKAPFLKVSRKQRADRKSRDWCQPKLALEHCEDTHRLGAAAETLLSLDSLQETLCRAAAALLFSEGAGAGSLHGPDRIDILGIFAG